MSFKQLAKYLIMLYNKNRISKKLKTELYKPGNHQTLTIQHLHHLDNFLFLLPLYRNALLSKHRCRSPTWYWSKDFRNRNTERWLRKQISYTGHSSWSGGSWIKRSNLLCRVKSLVHWRCWWLSAMILKKKKKIHTMTTIAIQRNYNTVLSDSKL